MLKKTAWFGLMGIFGQENGKTLRVLLRRVIFTIFTPTIHSQGTE
jgi:hypothetical protein